MRITKCLFIFSLRRKKDFFLVSTKIYERLFELANLCNGLLVFQVGDKHPEVVVPCRTSAAVTLFNTMQLSAIISFPNAVIRVVNFNGSAVAVDE
jgi:hypothetical protein